MKPGRCRGRRQPGRSKGTCRQGGGGRGEAASCLERQVNSPSVVILLLFIFSRMPPPDAETVELRSQLEGLVGKLKAKQEEVQD